MGTISQNHLHTYFSFRLVDEDSSTVTDLALNRKAILGIS